MSAPNSSTPGNTVSRLRRRVTLQQEVQTADGAGGYARTWQNVMDLWAEIVPITTIGKGAGRETLVGGQLQAQFSHRVLLRYQPDTAITSAMRLLYENRVFNIISVVDTNEDRATLQLLVLEGGVG